MTHVWALSQPRRCVRVPSRASPFPECSHDPTPRVLRPPGVESRGPVAEGRVVWGKRERVCRNWAEVGPATAEMQGISERSLSLPPTPRCRGSGWTVLLSKPLGVGHRSAQLADVIT